MEDCPRGGRFPGHHGDLVLTVERRRGAVTLAVVTIVDETVWRHILAVDHPSLATTATAAQARRHLAEWWRHLADRTADDVTAYAGNGRRFTRRWTTEDAVFLAHRYRRWRDGTGMDAIDSLDPAELEALLNDPLLKLRLSGKS